MFSSFSVRTKDTKGDDNTYSNTNAGVQIWRCYTAACDSKEPIAWLQGSLSLPQVYSSSTGFLKMTFTTDNWGFVDSGFTGRWSIHPATGTVVEIGGPDFDNNNVCPFANDGVCNDPVMTYGGTCAEEYLPPRYPAPRQVWIDKTTAWGNNVLGTFSDGSGDYENNEDCWWLIEAPGSAQITVRFLSFNTEKNYTKKYDGTVDTAYVDRVQIWRCDTAACESDSTELIASISGSASEAWDEIQVRPQGSIISCDVDLWWSA